MHCKVSRLGEINRQQLKFQSAVQFGPCYVDAPNVRQGNYSSDSFVSELL
jgi:hypothetical protein